MKRAINVTMMKTRQNIKQTIRQDRIPLYDTDTHGRCRREARNRIKTDIEESRYTLT